MARRAEQIELNRGSCTEVCTHDVLGRLRMRGGATELTLAGGTEGSNPGPSSGESGANLTSSIMLGYARSDSGPCRLGPTHAVIALVSAPGSTLADSHVAGPRGRSEEWYYKRGFWPRPFHYTEENRQRMLDPIEADD